MTFQQRVDLWVHSAFGTQLALDPTERNHRFFEEATELVQSLGMSREDAYGLIDYVYGRPAGEPNQELGGVMISVAALANAAGMNMACAAENEMARCETNIDRIREKQKNKPRIFA